MTAIFASPEAFDAVLTLLFAKPRASLPEAAVLREARRREIDTVLREDARRYPAFATARRCVVMSTCESIAVTTKDAARLLRCLREYEAARGGMSRASRDALDVAERVLDPDEVAVYERTRSLQ